MPHNKLKKPTKSNQRNYQSRTKQGKKEKKVGNSGGMKELIR